MSKQIEIEQDPDFQKKNWKFQKIGTVFLIIIFITAFTGLLGSGPLSKSTSENNYLKIEYPQFSRFSHPEEIMLIIKHNDDDDTVRLLISRDFIESVSLKKIIPEPESESFYQKFIEYRFLTEEKQDLYIHFDMDFRQSGKLTGTWGLKNKSTIQSNHFIFP